ncbi:MAG: TraR/DksA C4-type zinc finger protein [Armatimonadetes bacterium]|nr:TraR/DksA C4-type zinc finger protein [Armatimonadota bacterium]
MPRTDLDFDQFRKQLMEEREKALQSEHNADEIFDTSEEFETGELTTHDDHQADIATDLTNREQAVVLRDNIRHIIDQIDHALEKIDNGTYGICDDCGENIALERLEFEPYAAYCIKDQAKIEGTG